MGILYNDNLLIKACCNILGYESVRGMSQARIGPPEIVKLAALQCFVKQHGAYISGGDYPKDLATTIIRQALQDLYENGMFNYQKETNMSIEQAMKILR